MSFWGASPSTSPPCTLDNNPLAGPASELADRRTRHRRTQTAWAREKKIGSEQCLYSDKEGTSSKKKRDISEPESESETSEYEDGGSPSSQNTVLHKRKPRDDQRRSKFRNSREDTLLDVTCMNIRTSTPQESLVNTSEK